jgi:hypothetical protein
VILPFDAPNALEPFKGSLSHASASTPINLPILTPVEHSPGKKQPTMPTRQPIQPEAATPVENLWTTADVAAYLRVSPRFVQRQVSAGQLPKPVYVGRLPRWNAAVVKAYVGGCGK